MSDLIILVGSTCKNLELAQTLKETASSIDFSAEVINLVELNLPLYSAEAEGNGAPEAAITLRDKLIVAKTIITVAPEYNGSTPPVLSNAIAWVSRSGDDNWRSAFAKKFGAVATHSGGGGQKVLNVMRLQLEHLGTNVIARELLTHYQKPLNPDSALAVLSELKKLSTIVD